MLLISIIIIVVITVNSIRSQISRVKFIAHNIMKPTKNDVLSGRGAGFNQHPGNEQFRKMINIQKVSRMSQYIFSMAQLHQNCLERNS